MLCNLCKCEMRIEGSGYEAEGDDSPDTKTLIFIKQEFVCRNPSAPIMAAWWKL